ncbi:response regulator transcription factor [Arcobacter arenosus]|uniref:Response regulator transcription factor n=1 Tax=Arcobacter arenosus TaxID=2576037 RepID=A0A5R8XXN3_9BACT|nr:response regulator transcription factor [Arcobacter arenosus]TLP35510.1 response regulator transcription factor [Arcobacter arenosus]
MKIIALTKQDFLINELKKSSEFEIIQIGEYEEFYNLNISEESILFLQHLDSDDSDKIFQELSDNYNCKFIAIRNATNNIEGCTLLKKGFKSYIHSLSNISIIESVIETVKNGNTWVYPELMQFLINSIPLNGNNENKLFEDLKVKELEVLELVAQGLTNSKIANTLDIAEVTVKKHISSLFKKLKVKDRLALALVYKNNIN